jgi:hypothetical protein
MGDPMHARRGSPPLPHALVASLVADGAHAGFLGGHLHPRLTFPCLGRGVIGYGQHA